MNELPQLPTKKPIEEIIEGKFYDENLLTREEAEALRIQIEVLMRTKALHFKTLETYREIGELDKDLENILLGKIQTINSKIARLRLNFIKPSIDKQIAVLDRLNLKVGKLGSKAKALNPGVIASVIPVTSNLNSNGNPGLESYSGNYSGVDINNFLSILESCIKDVNPDKYTRPYVAIARWIKDEFGTNKRSDLDPVSLPEILASLHQLDGDDLLEIKNIGSSSANIIRKGLESFFVKINYVSESKK